MDRLLSAMAIFIEYPLLAAIIGVLLLVLGRATRRRTAVAVGWLWLLYSLYERGCTGGGSVAVSVTFGGPVGHLSGAAHRVGRGCHQPASRTPRKLPRRLEERVAA